MDYRLDRGRHEAGGVVGNEVVDVVGEALFFHFFHFAAHGVGEFEGVGPRLQEHRDRDRRHAVHAVGLVVALRAEFDARHVFQTHHAVGAAGAHDDLAEFLGLEPAAARGHSVDRLLALRRGIGADLAGGVLGNQGVYGGGNVTGGK